MSQTLLELLDERRISGPIAIRRLVGPSPLGHLVRSDDLADAVLAIESCCQLWGGVADLIVPWDATERRVLEPYETLMSRSSSRMTFGRQLIGSDDVSVGSSKVSPDSVRFAPSLLAVLAAQPGKPTERRPIRISLPAADDPWYLAYVACLGLLPPEPNRALHEYSGLSTEIRFEDLVEIQREPADTPGAEDLLARIRQTDASSPSEASRWLLGAARAQWGATALPHRYSAARGTGPNFVVVYSPGSVEDLCLLWNLRAASGLTPGAPIGVPVTADVRQAVTAWTEEMAFQQVTLWEAPKALVSSSVGSQTLGQIAADLGADWSVFEPKASLQPFPPPARTSSDVAVFENGRATVTMLGEGDPQVLGRVAELGARQDLQVVFELMSQALPPVRSIEPEFRHGGGGYQGGGYSVPVRDARGVTQIEWPSGWLVLAGAIRDRGGLRPRTSPAGKAASALLTRMGSLEAVESLLGPKLLDLLDLLCERRGMPWFRRQLRGMQAAVRESQPDAADQITAIADELRERPFDQEETAFVFDRFAEVLTKRGAQHWVPSAEEAGLLVRGVQVRCQNCGAKSWQSIAQFGASVACPGCGQVIERPFRADRLEFRYRASEALLAVSDHDALPHVLALRWFWRLFGSPFAERSELYGGYPGVELLREETGETHEVDLLLLMADGTLIPGELKRRGAGLKPGDLDKLDAVAEALDAPWSFLGTLDFSADCPPIWREARQGGPRPRYTLTGESLFAPSVSWPAFANPFDLPDGRHMLAQPDAVDSEFAEAQASQGRLRQREQVPGSWFHDGPET